ncbi:MAG TPA: hypothetical protein VGY57_16950 [Vicinamibacterales bacterium]|jgi:hypothetical protein|nr:hypothetical protein [Vicinamibacterales bacterium]
MLYAIGRRCKGLAFALIPAALGACGGHAQSQLPATSHAVSGTTSASLKIVIPKGGATSSTRRAPRYVSPATQSMTVHVTQHSGGATVLDETVGLTATSTGCASSLASTICTVQIPLDPGTYDMTIDTYDGYDGTHGTATGSRLSSGQTIGFTILAGQANTVSLTLSGIPAAIAVFSNAMGVRGGQTIGFTEYANLAQKFTVAALDADQNLIVGAGAPAFTIAAASGSGFTITNPTTTSPNTFSLAGSGTSGLTESFTATAAYSDGTCSTAGAVCSTTFSVTNVVQTLFVSNSNGNTVTVYNGPYATPSVTVSGINSPQGIATDGSGNLFVANNSTAYVAIYAPPYTGSPVHAGPNGSYTTQSVLIGPGNVLFADGGANAFTVGPPYTQTPTTITNSAWAQKQMSLDASGNLFIPDQNNNWVKEYAPPYTASPVATITSGISQPQQTLVDPSGNLFVLNDDAQLTEYAPPYTGAPTMIGRTSAQPTVMIMDADANLIVAYADNNTVAVYAKPYTGAPIATLSSGINHPVALAIDYAGDLFVANLGNSTVTEYASSYTGSPVATISSGVNGPATWGLALYPH